MTELAVSRRAVTCALASLPAIAIPTIAAAMSGERRKGDDQMNMQAKIQSHASTRGNWDDAVERYQLAVAAYNEHYGSQYGPTEDKIARIAPRPDLSFSVARGNDTQIRKVSPQELDQMVNHPQHSAIGMKLRDRWHQWMADKSAAEHRLGWQAIKQKHQELLNAMSAAEDNLIATPPRDAEDLARKVIYLEEMDIEEEYWSKEICEDAKQLARIM